MQFTDCSDEYKDGSPRGTEQGDSVLKDCYSQFERKQNARIEQRKEMWGSKKTHSVKEILARCSYCLGITEVLKHVKLQKYGA